MCRTTPRTIVIMIEAPERFGIATRGNRPAAPRWCVIIMTRLTTPINKIRPRNA
jgi:hypothetical protein